MVSGDPPGRKRRDGPVSGETGAITSGGYCDDVASGVDCNSGDVLAGPSGNSTANHVAADRSAEIAAKTMDRQPDTPEYTAERRTLPDRYSLRVNIHFLIKKALARVGMRAGNLPVPGSWHWWASDDTVKVAALLVVAEQWADAVIETGDEPIIRDPDEMAYRRLRQASAAISGGLNWKAAAMRPSHAELERRRAKHGPIASFDAAAAARWVATGRSDGAP